MLRPLIGRPVVAVIMATIGLAAMLRGIGPLLWGAETRPLPLPISDEPIVLGPLFIPPIQLLGAAVSLVFLAAFGWFFLKSRKGIAMRAVADNQQVAMAMGINVERYFALAWAMAGVVSALGGIVWGNLLGVDVHLALVGFKVFPVVILGGLDSIPGAIVGGLIVGIVENVAAGYVDPLRGRRHQGLRAVRADDRRPDGPALRDLRQADHRERMLSDDMIHRECGVLKTTLRGRHGPLPAADRALDGGRDRGGVLRSSSPWPVDEYYLSIVNLISIAVVGALGLNILVGYTGQISIGHGAFMSVGAYTAANLAVRLGLPVLAGAAAGGLMAAAVGAVVGIPSLRIKGLYLAIATLAGQLIIEWIINHVTWISGGVQASIEVPRPSSFGHAIATQREMYFFLLVFVVLAIVGHHEPRAQPDRARLHRHPRPGHRGRDHRHRHLPLQAPGLRHLVVLRRRHRGALHLLPRHRQLRAVPDRRVDRLPGHDHHRRAGLGAGLDLRGHLRHPAAHRDPRGPWRRFGGMLFSPAGGAQPHPQPAPDPVRRA